jgi:hypothetical protein
MRDERIDVNKVNKRGDTPFHNACRWGDIEIIKLFMNDPRINVNKENQNGKTAFENACVSGDVEVIKLLIQDKRVDVNKADHLGRTPIHDKCMNFVNENLGIIELLLKHGANPFIVPNVGLRAYDSLPETLDVNTIARIQHAMKLSGYMYGHISENNNLLNLPDAEFVALRNQVNTLLTTNSEVMNIFASKIFHQTAPKNGLLDALTPKSMDFLANELKNLCIKSNLCTLNGSDKIDALIKMLEGYNKFSEKQMNTIKSGLESNNSAVLDSLTHLLYSFEKDIDEMSEDYAFFPGSLLEIMNIFNVGDLKPTARLDLYRDVIDNISLLRTANKENDATIMLINHLLLPKVKDLMVEYISNMIQRVASAADCFQGQEKETVAKYFPQSLNTKSLGELQNVIHKKFNDILVEFSQKGYDKTTHGFAIYVIEELNSIGHNNTEYSFINEVLRTTAHDNLTDSLLGQGCYEAMEY